MEVNYVRYKIEPLARQFLFWKIIIIKATVKNLMFMREIFMIFLLNFYFYFIYSKIPTILWQTPNKMHCGTNKKTRAEAGVLPACGGWRTPKLGKRNIYNITRLASFNRSLREIRRQNISLKWSTMDKCIFFSLDISSWSFLWKDSCKWEIAHGMQITNLS